MDIKIEKLHVNSDSRGLIAEILKSKDVKKHNYTFGHLFFVTFADKKAVRGNHYHAKKHEYYIVIAGKIKVFLIDIRTKNKKTLTLSAGKKIFYRLRIGPNIAHACHSLSTGTLMIGYYSQPYERNKDTYIYEVIKTKNT